jgi:hypothetical protein
MTTRDSVELNSFWYVPKAQCGPVAEARSRFWTALRLVVPEAFNSLAHVPLERARAYWKTYGDANGEAFKTFLKMSKGDISKACALKLEGQRKAASHLVGAVELWLEYWQLATDDGWTRDLALGNLQAWLSYCEWQNLRMPPGEELRVSPGEDIPSWEDLRMPWAPVRSVGTKSDGGDLDSLGIGRGVEVPGTARVFVGQQIGSNRRPVSLMRRETKGEARQRVLAEFERIWEENDLIRRHHADWHFQALALRRVQRWSSRVVSEWLREHRPVTRPDGRPHTFSPSSQTKFVNPLGDLIGLPI